MKSAFRSCLRELAYLYLFLVCLGVSLFVVSVVLRWLFFHGFLWVIAAFASIVFAVIAFRIERDRREEQSINAKFDDDFSEMYDSMEKKPAYAQLHPDWQDLLRERHRVALTASEAVRWGSACRFWMLATVSALVAVVMLYVSSNR